ncbi:MAG: agmatinase [Phycisphaerae bacterium]|nr:agmatinase [Phycisphaerae bacterium]
MASIPDNFLGLSGAAANYAKARYAVLPVPYDATTSFQAGTRGGPRAIVTASQQVELFDDELLAEFGDAGIATLDPLEPIMTGPEAMHEAVFAAAKRIVRDGKCLIGLGGEHSISSGLVRGVMTRHKRLSVLHVDAHADLRDQYEGTPFSHASVMRRILDLGATIVPVGIRNFSHEEHRFMQKAGIKPLTARYCHSNSDWIEQAVERLGETVYVTIDIDGFDPAFAPGTGTPEPGGLGWYGVTGLLRRVIESRTVVGADVVEVMPIPGNAATEFLAARLAYKIIAYREHAQGQQPRRKK